MTKARRFASAVDVCRLTEGQALTPFSFVDMNPQAQPDSDELKVVAVASRPIPQAGIEAGDAVIFRPNHKDPTRRFLVQHPVEPDLLLEALEDGSLEIIGAESVSSSHDLRSLLRRLLRRPRERLSLVR